MTFSPELRAKLQAFDFTTQEIKQLERFSDYTTYDEAELVEAIKNGEDFTDELTEYAEGCVSVYTYDRFQWAADNVRAVREHEDDALGTGAKSIEDLIAYCWYRAEEESMRELLVEVSKELNVNA